MTPRRLGVVAAWIGAIASAVLVVYAGRHYGYRLVLVLFVLWAISPFVVFALAQRLSKRWPRVAPAGLDSIMVLAAIASIVVYSYAIVRPGRAVPFVVVPLVSWILIVLVIVISMVTTRRES